MNIEDLNEQEQKEILTQLTKKYPGEAKEALQDIEENEGVDNYLNEKFGEKKSKSK